MNDTIIACTGRVTDLSPVVDSDNLLAASVVCGQYGKWQGIVARNTGVAVNDLVEVYLPDALLPPTDSRFAFMATRKYRVSIMRLRGALSEALIMPLSPACAALTQPGIDIMPLVGATKYVKDVIDPKYTVGVFPSGIPKTDEINLQATLLAYGGLWGLPYVATIKYDGTSTTAYWDDKTAELRVCSRNLIVKGGQHWAAANAYPLLSEYLRAFPNLALQWETVGPGVQRNTAGLRTLQARLFLVYDQDAGQYLSWHATRQVAHAIQMPLVDAVASGNAFDLDEQTIANIVAGTRYPQTTNQVEGLVFRTQGAMGRDKAGFKYLSPDYKH